MRFLLDVCVSRLVGEYLESVDHEVLFVHTRDSRMQDEEILHWAFEEDLVLVTNDKDFGRFVFLLHQPHAGLIRLPSAHGKVLVALMRQILAKHMQDLSEDVVITATRERIRIRKTHSN